MSPMSTTTEPHDQDAPGHSGAVVHHSLSDHGDDHGHDDHAHADGALGPLDARAWGAAAIGVGLGLVIAVCFAVATA